MGRRAGGKRSVLGVVLVLASSAPLLGLLAGRPVSTPADNSDAVATPVRHVVEIMLENHSFDNLFANFSGADGMPHGQRFPAPGAYFTSLPSVAPVVAGPNEGDVYGGINNSRPAEKMAMDYTPGRGYLMDGYTLYPTDGLASVTELPPPLDPNLQYLARHYELADMNFQPAIAPTQPNVDYALAATSNGWTYNNTPPASKDRWSSIFDELSRAGRSWGAFFGTPLSDLQGTVWEHLVPPGTSADLAPVSQFLSDLSDGRLPDFSLIRPGVGYSEEPPEDVGEGDAWLGQLVSAVANSAYWASTAIFVTYDEGGGFFDHVRPPVVDPYGYGTRTPMVIVSPYARRGVLGARTTNISILSFVQHLWGLAPLDALNARQNDLIDAFDFRQPPLPPPTLPVAPAETIGFYGSSSQTDVPTPAPGAPVTIHLRVNTAALLLDETASGVVRLACVPPLGDAVPAGFPRSVPLSGGEGGFVLRFPVAGYYRIEARGPGSSRGWVTVDVGVGPNAAP